ncbi:MAG: thioredoxin family protein [Maritimibacter sp.]
MKRREFLAAGAALAVLPTGALAKFVTYTPGALNKALDAGETVILDFYAPWCGTCVVQHKVIDRLKGENPAYDAKITFIQVDWDTYKKQDITQSLQIPRRSTLVAVGPDRRELGRIVAATGYEDIKALLDTALAASA